MHIEGHLSIWFNPNSVFKMEFSKVSVTDMQDMLHILQQALDEPPYPETMLQQLIHDYSAVCSGDLEALARDYPASAPHIEAWQKQRDELQQRAKAVMGQTP